MAYNYLDNMILDIEGYLADRFGRFPKETLKEEFDNYDDFVESVEEDLWTEDSVTGNGSGSYTFNREEAKSYVIDNISLLREAATNFDCMEQLAKDFLDENWEDMDVLIRCYLLSQAFTFALHGLMIDETDFVKEDEDVED